jgi:hypothetical protein
MLDVYYQNLLDLQIAERESNELRAELGERAAAGERERERRPVSGRGSDGWRAGERVAAGKRKRE